jgi:hypothetical protein
MELEKSQSLPTGPSTAQCELGDRSGPQIGGPQIFQSLPDVCVLFSGKFRPKLSSRRVRSSASLSWSLGRPIRMSRYLDPRRRPRGAETMSSTHSVALARSTNRDRCSTSNRQEADRSHLIPPALQRLCIKHGNRCSLSVWPNSIAQRRPSRLHGRS